MILIAIAVLLGTISLIGNVRHRDEVEPRTAIMIGWAHLVPSLILLVFVVQALATGRSADVQPWMVVVFALDAIVGVLYLVLTPRPKDRAAARVERARALWRNAMATLVAADEKKVRAELAGAIDVLLERDLIDRETADRAREAPLGLLGVTLAPALMAKASSPGGHDAESRPLAPLIEEAEEWTPLDWWKLEIRSFIVAPAVVRDLSIIAPQEAVQAEYTKITGASCLRSLSYLYAIVGPLVGAAMMIRWSLVSRWRPNWQGICLTRPPALLPRRELAGGALPIGAAQRERRSPCMMQSPWPWSGSTRRHDRYGYGGNRASEGRRRRGGRDRRRGEAGRRLPP
ncbi:hypothetical protein IM711_03490 [Microbacterium esteraromaticum]|uniref:hypothetical protein n=1 Tax=Microbacterium esteraromaticum TaxID=57043 RepID=UPI003C2DE805